MFRPVRVCCIACLTALSIACAEPPHKEMNQAQGAIDAARAAGADEYASTELTAAIDALKRSEEAVAQKDYRLALSFAIDSRERAQAAAKAAVETRAKARGTAERVIAEANSLIGQARRRLDDEATAKLPRRTVADARATLADGEKSMQEARAALDRDEYPRAIELARAITASVQEALASLERPAPPMPARKRR
jgi:hypothetical protein